MVSWNQDIATQYHQNSGLLGAGEVATGGLAQQRMAALSDADRAAYMNQLNQFKSNLGTSAGPGGVVPATAEPLHAWEKSALTQMNDPGLLGGGNRQMATQYLQDLMQNTDTINPLAQGYMEQAGQYAGRGAEDITFEQVEAKRNPYSQALKDRLSEEGAQIRQQIMAQQGGRGGRSFGDISTGRRDSYLDAELLRGKSDIDYKTYQDASSMMENQRRREAAAGGMFGSLGTGAQNITTSGINNAMGMAGSVFDAGTQMTELQRDVNRERLGAGAYIRDYNQRINDLMGQEMLAAEGDEYSRLANVQNLLKSYQSGQTAAVPGTSTMGQLGGVATALGGSGIFDKWGSSGGLTNADLEAVLGSF